MLSELNVQIRKDLGTRHSRRLRHAGTVPGIVYGADKSSMPVSINGKELRGMCVSSVFFNRVLMLNTGSEKEKVLPKSISRHPVSGNILHVDFMRVSSGTKVKIFVPVEVINEDKAPGIKKGGIVNLVVHKLECLCDPETIPEVVTLDLTGKEIGDSFTLDATSLPDGVEAINAERDNVLATIVVSKVGKEEDTATSSTATTSETTPAKSE